MNEHNTRKLFDRYPRLYQGRHLPLEKNLMSWGFCCDDGWFDLIDDLSSAIEIECRRLHEVAGWDENCLPIATQVKEKMGTIRFHVSKKTPVILALIEKARDESEKICERCGKYKLGECCCGLPVVWNGG